MADEIVVGTYDSRREAEGVRAQLLDRGVRGDRIHIEEGSAPGTAALPADGGCAVRDVDQPLPEDRGISGFIARMFSGALMDDPNVETHRDALRNGRCLVVVRADSHDERHAVSTILAPSGPRIYSLPNAPTAWNEATANDPASIGSLDEDPARPEGLLTGVEGLSAHADVVRLSSPPGTGRRR